MSELKPCPFCGGEASREHHTQVEILGKMHPGELFETGCDNVGCPVLPSVKKLMKYHADEAWNTRSTGEP